MRTRRAYWLSSLALPLTLACSSSGGGDTSASHAPRLLDFNNGGFESGNLTGWTVTTMLVPSAGMAIFPPEKFADLGLGAGGTNLTSAVSSSTSGYPVPAGLQASDTLTYPFQGSYATVVNREGENRNVNVLTQSMIVTAADVDPADGNVHVRFAIGPVLDNPGHNPNEQPYFFIELDDTTTNTEFFETYNFANQAGVEWQQLSSSDPSILYTDWQAFDVAPGPSGIGIGDTIKATVVAAGCALGGHWGEVYVDAFGTHFPVPNVNVSAPAYVQASSPLTYTILAKNGGNGAATNVIVTWATPTMTDNTSPVPQTVPVTFTSLSAPGASCTAPAAGTTGTVTCNIGSLSPGGSYAFTATVAVPPLSSFGSLAVAPVYVNEGTYGVQTDQTPFTGGGLVQTQVTTNNPVDLEASLTDGVAAITWGASDTYTFVVTNDGPTAVSGVTITDSQPSAFSGTSWSCAGSNGGLCGATGGNGAVLTVASLPVGASVTITVNTTFSGGPASANETYTITATPPLGYVQSVPLHNIGTDTDAVSGALETLTILKDAASTGTGRVVTSPQAIDCGTGCSSASAGFTAGTFVSVSAIAPSGQTFTGWSGACTGLTTPCNLTVTGATTLTARFDQPTLQTSVSSTSNGGSTNVRPGDTATYSVLVTVPENNNAGVTVSDAFPADLAFVSSTSPTVTGNIVCSTPGGCTSPAVTGGATTSVDFGVVSCTTAGGCELSFTVTGIVKTTAVRGDSIVDVLSVAGTSTNAPALTVIEPSLAMSRTVSPASGLLPGQTSTVTVTLENDTGGANSDAWNVALALPAAASMTAGSYAQGTCPAATATFGATSSTFVFPVGVPSAFPVGTNCTFSYVVTLSPTAPYSSSLPIPAGTATSQSIPGSVPPAKQYVVSDTGASVSTTALATGQPCVLPTDCLAGVCDPSDNECGYANDDGSCTPANALLMCQSGVCSVSGVCEAPGTCLADGDCTSSQYCNTVTNLCTPKLPNSSLIPTIGGHTPALAGLCPAGAAGASLAAIVCQSGVCDPSNNECGIALGDGTCAATTQCQAGVCVASGPNVGLCELCGQDSDCSGATPACNQTTGTCVTCTATMATACVGATPLCNTATNSCIACNASSSAACTGGHPVCNVATSSCVACQADFGAADAGSTCPSTSPVCNVTTGACGAPHIDAGSDSGHPAGHDAGSHDSGASDGAADALSDAPSDASSDAGTEASAHDAGTKPSVDAGKGHPSRDASSSSGSRDASVQSSEPNENPDGLAVQGGGCTTSRNGGSSDGVLAGLLLATASFLRRRRGQAA